MPEMIRIEKNSVKETLLIPLYSRVQCTRLYPEIYSDPLSEEALGRIDYPFKETVKKDSMMIRFGALEAAMRQYDIKDIIPWIEDAKVTYKGYLLGYNDLSIPGVSGMFRLLSKIGDGSMKMKIVTIEF